MPTPTNENASDGDRQHKACQAAVEKLEPKLLPNTKLRDKIKGMIGILGGLKDVKILTERRIEFDKNWKILPLPKGNKTFWGVTKTDLTIRVPNKSIIIDYKRGERYGNEYKHFDQGTLYGLVELLARPELDTVSVEFWYHKTGAVWPLELDRDKAMKALAKFDERVAKMFAEKLWRPRANIVTCKWCPYRRGDRGNGACPVSQ